MRRRVVITGVGAVTPLGVGAETLIDRWIDGHCGIEDGEGQADEFDPIEFMTRKEARRSDRFAQFAIAASDEALGQAGWSEGLPYEPQRVGCVVGTGIGGLSSLEEQENVLRERGEFVDAQALSPEGTFVRFDGEGKPPVTDGPFAETKDLIAGWMIIDVDSYERAVELAGELSAAPGAGGKPIHEWLEVRPFLSHSPTITE